jgi:TonB family protein
MSRSHRSLVLSFVVLSVVVAITTFASASDLDRKLQDNYLHKIFVLRGFYPDSKLHYDSTGALAGGMPGDWTTDGLVRIDEIRVSGDTLKIKAERLLVISSKQGLQIAGKDLLKKEKDAKKREVELDARVMSGDLTEDQANAILSGIFLNSQDSFVDAVPEYWKPCIADGLSGKNSNCSLSSEMSEAPGMTNPSRGQASTASAPSQGHDAGATKARGVFRVGGGVKPPRAVYQPEPEFTEIARKVKYQGVMTMALIVDENGLPQKISVQSPLGAGLDEKALHAVESWKFQPAQKDGHPVPVAIAVEVDFHLY